MNDIAPEVTRQQNRQKLVDLLMQRLGMFTSASEQIQSFLFSVHGGGLVAALAFLSSERGKLELNWLAPTIALLILGVLLCGVIRALTYFSTRGLLIAMGDAIKEYDQRVLTFEQTLPYSLPAIWVRLGYVALGLGVGTFILFAVALCLTVANLLIPQM